MPMKTFRVGLGASGTNSRLLTLVQTLDAQVRGSCRELVLEADPGNGTGRIFVGDSQISATQWGYSLSAGNSREHRSDRVSVPLNEIYVRPDAASLRLGVMIMEG